MLPTPPPIKKRTIVDNSKLLYKATSFSFVTDSPYAFLFLLQMRAEIWCS